MDRRLKKFIENSHLYSRESDLHKIISKRKKTLGSNKISINVPPKRNYSNSNYYLEDAILEFMTKNGIYSDESKLKKIRGRKR